MGDHVSLSRYPRPFRHWFAFAVRIGPWVFNVKLFKRKARA